MRFNKLDLNLLPVLDVLLSTRSVTRAAERLFLSQPATSLSLRRLRAYFEDELLVPVGKDAHGAPILAVNPVIAAPVVPAGGIYTGGIASSGIGGLTGNYLNLPGQQFLKAPFTLRFAKPGVYTYYCLVHPGMAGTITVLPATAASGRS